MNQQTYNRVYAECQAGGMSNQESHNYATDMATRSVSDTLNEKAEARSLEAVRSERDALLVQVSELRALVQAIPRLILTARLDAQAGKQTIYDYAKANRACRVNP